MTIRIETENPETQDQGMHAGNPGDGDGPSHDERSADHFVRDAKARMGAYEEDIYKSIDRRISSYNKIFVLYVTAISALLVGLITMFFVGGGNVIDVTRMGLELGVDSMGEKVTTNSAGIEKLSARMTDLEKNNPSIESLKDKIEDLEGRITGIEETRHLRDGLIQSHLDSLQALSKSVNGNIVDSRELEHLQSSRIIGMYETLATREQLHEDRVRDLEHAMTRLQEKLDDLDRRELAVDDRLMQTRQLMQRLENRTVFSVSIGEKETRTVKLWKGDGYDVSEVTVEFVRFHFKENTAMVSIKVPGVNMKTVYPMIPFENPVEIGDYDSVVRIVSINLMKNIFTKSNGNILVEISNPKMEDTDSANEVGGRTVSYDP